LSQDPFATVFDRTFNIFDPYPPQRKLVYRFLSVLMVVAIGVSFALLPLLMTVIASGFGLSAFIMIVGLNLVVIEEAPDVYEQSGTFCKVVQSGTQFADGDLKVLRLIRKLSPKLSKYFIGLSALFFGFAVTLPFLATSVPWLFNRLVDSIMRSSGMNGILVMEAVGAVLGVNLGLLHLFAYWVKGKMFRYEI
jgi:uncharacterized membrane protein